MKKGKSKKGSFFATCLKDYTSSSTVHGIRYILADDTPVLDRLLWLLLLLCCVVSAAYLVIQSYTTWQSSLVITTLKTVARPVSELQFPAITICGSGQHFTTVEQILANNFHTWNNNRNTTDEGATLKDDFTLYMKEVFELSDTRLNILDILSTIVSPHTSGANAVRNNQIACHKITNKNKSRKKRDTFTGDNVI